MVGRLDGPAPVPLNDPPFDVIEAPGELVDRPTQGPLRVDAGVARQVPEREEHVPEFLLDGGGIAAIEGPIELPELLVHLRARAPRVRPIETHARDLLAYPLRPGQRRQAAGNAAEHAAVFEQFAQTGLGGDLEMDVDTRNERLEQMTEAETGRLEALDERFLALPNIDDHLTRYLRDRPGEFFV